MITPSRLLILSLLISGVAARAEIEGEMRIEGFAPAPAEWIILPIAVSVVDADGNPVAGASVALMRLGDGGYTEQDVFEATNPMTNEAGIAVVSYPTQLVGEGPFDPDRDYSKLIGAVTVACAGFNTVSIELEERYPTPLKARDVSLTPWLRFELETTNQKNAEQGGAGEPATRSESDSQGSDKPQPDSEGRPR